MEHSLKEISREIRKHIIRMHQQGTGVGSSLSIVDILVVLYFDVMNIESPDNPERDRFILSKGHAASALYATLAKKKFFDEGVLSDYFVNGKVLWAHPVRGSLPGIEASTGSLGHGLPIAIGMALAAKRDNKKFKIFALLGDGECQEGSVWEAAMIASRLKLSNMVVIIDANDCQGYDRVREIQPINTFKAKWESFGWNVIEVDGHDFCALKKAFERFSMGDKKPSVIIAHTIMGKGIAEMEDKLEWHYYSVPKERVESFINELEVHG